MLVRIKGLLPKGERSLQARFQVGLAAILIFLCILSAVAIYSLQRRILEREALRQTEIVMSAIEATRSYIRDTLRPRMYELLPENRFVLEAMSTSYVSRVVWDKFQEDMPEFGYRRVAFNARNPTFNPNNLEKEMIRYFRNNPDESSWYGMTRQQGRQQFVRFEPVRFRDTCLRCHGEPDEAPDDILYRYGSIRGFGHDIGEVSGVVSVFIPVDGNLSGIRNTAFWIFMGVLFTICILYLLVWGFFQRLVVTNLHGLLGIFRETVSDARGTDLYEKIASRDELSELLAGTRVLAEHLRDTRHQLEGHAAELEKKVAIRTEALENSHDRLRRQMRQRNRELLLFTTIAELATGSDSLKLILSKILERTLQVIPVRGGGIYLKQSEQCLELACQKNADDLPELIDTEIFEANYTSKGAFHARENYCNRIRIIDDRAETISIPLCCRNNDQGLLFITGLNPSQFDESLLDLLLSVGNQIGITIESLQNIGALRKSEQLLQSVINGISDPLILLDTQGSLQMANQAFLASHGLSMHKTLGQPLSRIISGESCFVGLLEKPFGFNNPRPQNDTVTLKEGSVYDVFQYPVIEQDGVVESMICLARDVTELKKVEQKIRQTEKMVAVGQLAAGVAHEINNPLGVILCYTEILKDDIADSTQGLQDIEVIEKHVHGCQHIISDLLDFARGGDSIKKEVKLNTIIEEVLTIVRTQLRKEDIRIVAELFPDPPGLLLDADKIKQVVMNLVINAAQAIDGAGVIGVYTIFLAQRNLIQLIVEDNGCGIPEEVAGKIFDPFFTTKEPGQGTGLGLSIAYEIIKDHGAEIQVESEPGSWTRFTISFPVVEDESQMSTIYDKGGDNV